MYSTDYLFCNEFTLDIPYGFIFPFSGLSVVFPRTIGTVRMVKRTKKAAVPNITMAPVSFKIDKFFGLSSGTLSPENFLNTFDSYSTVYKFDNDAQKVAAFHLHLEGEALTWFNGLPTGKKDTWAHAKGAFRERFIEHNEQNAPDMVSAMQMFGNMSLSPGQSIGDYYTLITEKAKALNKTPAETLLRFVEGLPQELAFFVRAGRPNTTEEALTAARNGEAYNYRCNKACNNIPLSQSTDDRVDTLAKQIEKLTTLVDKQQQQQQQLQQQLQQQQQPQQQQQARYQQPRYQQPAGAQATPPTCEICKGVWHDQSRCNKRANFGPRPNMKCYTCGQFGHGQRACMLQQGN